MENTYIITTDRLGLRNWKDTDVAPFASMCANAKVMEHFPSTLSYNDTADLVSRLSTHCDEHGYTYFAVDVLDTEEFIGFAGLKNQDWESDFTPCVDIGYRLKENAWGKGYATEAAKACLEMAFTKFNIHRVLSFTTDTNAASEHVMKKIGMTLAGTVQHPSIVNDPRFKHCVVYQIEKGQDVLRK